MCELFIYTPLIEKLTKIICVTVQCGPDVPGGVRVPGSRRRRRPSHQHPGQISLQPTKRGKQQVGRLVHGKGLNVLTLIVWLFECITHKEFYITKFQYVVQGYNYQTNIFDQAYFISKLIVQSRLNEK